MARKYTLQKKSGVTPDPTILDSLNPVQREAAEHVEGPLLILAGAGSGKTRVITHRIAHLIRNEGVGPDQILAVTFTNKASQEMRERVDELLGEENRDVAWRVTISTFHALCARLLRRHADKLGLDRQFAIYDDSDQNSLIKRVLGEGDNKVDRGEVRRLRDFVESMKNAGRTPTQAHEVAHSAQAEENVLFYEAYQKALRDSNCVDFGDLILGVLEIFRANPKLAKSYSEQWQYVMVDEFQDTNPAQYELLQHLTCAHRNLAVVGDDDQSIYRWRGATVGNILGFDSDYEQTKVVKLEQNYRSTQMILDAANDLIQRNQTRHPKRLWTEQAGGEPITCFTATDEREEASWVATRIEELRADGLDYPDMAIFYRTNAQARAFEEQLRFAGTPYQIIGGISFYARAEIKDLLGYVKVALNPANEVDLLRVLNTPTRGIGQSTIDKLRVAAALPQIGSLWGAIEWLVKDADETTDQTPPGWLPGIDAPLQIDPELEELRSLRGRPTNGLRSFHDIITNLRDELVDAENRLAPIVMRLIDTIDYRSYLEKSEPERVEDKMRNLHELVNAIDDFQTDSGTDDGPIEQLRQFLDRSALIAQADAIDESLGAVTLMTVHSSKGLEFEAVFLAGMEDEVFPSLREEDDQELEEERRLAYVAITRAKRRLFLSNALRRRIFGQYRDMTASRFLADIDQERIVVDPRSARHARTSTNYRQPWKSGRRSEVNIGRGTAEWDYDQSPPMQMGAVARAKRELEATKKQFDEFSQLPTYEEFGAQPAAAAAGAGKELVGAVCSHTQFGMGKIKAVSGTGDMATLTVRFTNGAEKKIKRKWVKVMG